jgi:hypothetical protein
LIAIVNEEDLHAGFLFGCHCMPLAYGVQDCALFGVFDVLPKEPPVRRLLHRA